MKQKKTSQDPRVNIKQIRKIFQGIIDDISETNRIPDIYSAEFNEKISKEALPDSELRGLISPEFSALITIFTIIEARLIDIEDKLFPQEKKLVATKTQKLLLLRELGMLEPIKAYPLKSRAFLLSLITGSSEDNIRHDLSIIDNEKNPKLVTEQNYKFLLKVYQTLKVPERIKKIELALDKINQKKPK